MNFIKRIKALFPDKYIGKDVRAGKKGDSTIQVARLSHVNEVGKAAEAGLQLVADGMTSSTNSTLLPTSTLQRTATEIEFSDGVKLVGYKLITFHLLNDTNALADINTVRIGSPDGGTTPGGFYLPYSVGGCVKADDSALSPAGTKIISTFQNGSDMTDTSGGANDGLAIQTDQTSISAFNNTANVDNSVDVDFGVIVSPEGGVDSTAEIFVQYEFLAYSTADVALLP